MDMDPSPRWKKIKTKNEENDKDEEEEEEAEEEEEEEGGGGGGGGAGGAQFQILFHTRGKISKGVLSPSVKLLHLPAVGMSVPFDVFVGRCLQPSPLLCSFEVSTAAVQQEEDWRQERFFVKDRVSCCVAD